MVCRSIISPATDPVTIYCLFRSDQPYWILPVCRHSPHNATLNAVNDSTWELRTTARHFLPPHSAPAECPSVSWQ